MKKQQSMLSHYLNIDDFSSVVKTHLSKTDVQNSCITLISLDFDNFNYINDLFGYEVGDTTLLRVSEHFDNVLQGNSVFCNLHADHFVFFIDTDNPSFAAQMFLQLSETKNALKNVLPEHYSLVARGGILITKDSSSPLSALLDKTNYARKKAKSNSLETFCIYNEEMRDDIEWRKQLTLIMESSLKNNEFKMYLQPKILVKTGEVIGSEALARWQNPDLGIIYPDKFIPIMEQNGFIRQLDFFMLEQACLFLKASKTNGIPVLPISINFSKAHILTPNVVERIFSTVNRHGISTHLIEIEFTESIFSDNINRLIEIVSDLKLLGFKVSIDDFGSGYSSLNYLKDIPIDIIKIDKNFLDASANNDKGKVILAKVVEMIKSLRMISVMEGVEEKEQVDFLQKLSCDLGQGYFYARPMPSEDYLKHILKENTLEDFEQYLNPISEDRSYLHVIPQEFQMDNWELYTLGKNIDMGLMKGYLDGEATVQYVNDRALEYLGYNRQEFREVFNNSIVAFTHPDDAATVQKNAEQLITSGKPLAFQTRAIRKDGKVIVLQGRSSCVIDSHGRPVGLYAFQDVTESLEEIATLKSSLEDKITQLEKIISEKDELINLLKTN